MGFDLKKIKNHPTTQGGLYVKVKTEKIGGFRHTSNAVFRRFRFRPEAEAREV
jgi:hypothetical protein